ncbi:MAG: energy transducer TonB [Crocinitomicaceae bacterium]|nr:energy transducer TonB [Crocinitomicaceae bacterium]
MKYLILFVSLLCIAPSFAKKTYTFKMVIRDIYSNERLSNCPVQLDDGVNQKQIVLDENGIVFYEGLQNKEISVTIITKNGNYEEEDFKVVLEKKGDNFYKAYLKPSTNFKNALTLREDKLHGTVDESSLGDTSSIDCEVLDSSYIFAMFKGGHTDLQNYIAFNLHYPEYSIENEDQCKIMLSFIVEPDEEATHIKIIKGATMQLDRAAVKLIQRMSKWIPGECKRRENTNEDCPTNCV